MDLSRALRLDAVGVDSGRTTTHETCTDAVTSLASYNSKPADQPAATLPALAATIGGEVFLGQARQTPTDPRNLLMLARASCTRCRDCGREDSATSLDVDALHRWQAKSMPGHVIAHILDSW
jgi:hypothetical protein